MILKMGRAEIVEQCNAYLEFVSFQSLRSEVER